VAQEISCGPDLERHLAAIRAYTDAGFTHVAVIQIGAAGQGNFLDVAEKELLPALRSG
jgi:hypothetical protein